MKALDRFGSQFTIQSASSYTWSGITMTLAILCIITLYAVSNLTRLA